MVPTFKKLLYSLLFACMVFMQGVLLAHDHDSHQMEPENCFSCLHKLASVALITGEFSLSVTEGFISLNNKALPFELLLPSNLSFLARAPPTFLHN